MFTFGQGGKVLQFDLKDTTFTLITNSYGLVDYYIESDTVYGTTKDATCEIKQAPYGMRGVRVDGGLVTFNDTLNEFRLIKQHTPAAACLNTITFSKNSVDSAVVRLKVIITTLRQ